MMLANQLLSARNTKHRNRYSRSMQKPKWKSLEQAASESQKSYAAASPWQPCQINSNQVFPSDTETSKCNNSNSLWRKSSQNNQESVHKRLYDEHFAKTERRNSIYDPERKDR